MVVWIVVTVMVVVMVMFVVVMRVIVLAHVSGVSGITNEDAGLSDLGEDEQTGLYM